MQALQARPARVGGALSPVAVIRPPPAAIEAGCRTAQTRSDRSFRCGRQTDRWLCGGSSVEDDPAELRCTINACDCLQCRSCRRWSNACRRFVPARDPTQVECVCGLDYALEGLATLGRFDMVWSLRRASRWRLFAFDSACFVFGWTW